MKGFGVVVLSCFVLIFYVCAQDTRSMEEQLTHAEALLNQKPAESLVAAGETKSAAQTAGYKKGTAHAMALMGVASYKIDEYDQAKTSLLQALALSEEIRDSSILSFSKYWLGNLDFNQGQFVNALEQYETGFAIAKASGDKKNMARALDGMAGVFETLDEDDKALDYYHQSLSLAREGNFNEWVGVVTSELGNLAYKKGHVEEAITKFQEAIRLSEESNNINTIANSYQQLASIYYAKGDLKQSMKYIQQAMDLFEQTGSMSSFSYSRLLMSSILLKDKEYDLAISLAKMSFDEGKAKGETQLQKDAAETLYQAYNSKGDKATALSYHELFHNLSVVNDDRELARRLTRMDLQSRFEKEREIAKAQQASREAEIKAERERQQLIKNASFAGIGLASIIALLAIFAFFQKRKDNRLIADEKRKSDELLLNILPAEVAHELKENGKAKAKNYERATVLFADIKNFTGTAEKMSPENLVAEIDFYFQNFDKIIGRYKIEKIKTMGDAYLCVGGLPVPDTDNAIHIVSAALEIQKFVGEVKEERMKKGQMYFEIRVGIHSGPLVAGIVGLKKFAYDIWGDTVNVAARMEQNGEEGKINITGSTYELVKDKFACTYRGKIEAKNRGQIDMYFVDGAV